MRLSQTPDDGDGGYCRECTVDGIIKLIRQLTTLLPQFLICPLYNLVSFKIDRSFLRRMRINIRKDQSARMHTVPDHEPRARPRFALDPGAEKAGTVRFLTRSKTVAPLPTELITTLVL